MNAISFDIAAACRSDAQSQARAQGLRYVSDTGPGFSRRRYGKAFVFFDAGGQKIRDEAIVARIRKLAIPPAYRNVWICPHPNGHLQATAFDARGRKQYRYHADWRSFRDANKFNHMLAFGDALPLIRQTVRTHMAQRSLSREKVLATVVALLEKTLIRVGNDEYARANQSYGLTTLRDEHVEVAGAVIRFRFKGKSGKEWNLKLSDRRIANIIRACTELDGQELFKYADSDGNPRDISSSDVNAYLREITGEPFTAKDFRTWTGTVLAVGALSGLEIFDSPASAKKNVATAIGEVAHRLGNTPSVCRKCYVHPDVVSAYLDGGLIDQIGGEIDEALLEAYAGLSAEEVCVLRFLKERLKGR